MSSGIRRAALAQQAAGVPATALTRWLLRVPQIDAGPHAGAIAGLLEDGRSASYVYPEIAGYYLRWLAFRARLAGDDADLAAPAQAVQRWLVHWTALAGPPTRVFLDGTAGDWRNDALFCFDLAMVLRGLGSAARQGLIAPQPALVRDVAALLQRCIGPDGELDAVVPRTAGVLLPARWSTQRGPFLAKAAAGVLRAAGELDGIPVPLVRAAEATFASSIAALAQAPHAEVHPLLYACEGILDLPRHPRFAAALPIVASTFAALGEHVSAHGDLPESTRAGGPARVDVIAQALRVGYLLAAHDASPPPAVGVLARLQAALVREIGADGGLRFARTGPASQRNTWAAMFADQALAFAAGDPVARDALRDEPLLV